MQKRWLESKRGISPLIATVALVGLVVVIAGIFLLTTRSLIRDQAEKEQCGPQDILIDFIPSCSINPEGYPIVNLACNSQFEAVGVLMNKIGGGGTFITEPVDCKEGEERNVGLRVQNVESVEIFPGIIKKEGDNARVILCTDLKTAPVPCS